MIGAAIAIGMLCNILARLVLLVLARQIWLSGGNPPDTNSVKFDVLVLLLAFIIAMPMIRALPDL
jgi:hypothetical protein